MEVAVVAALVAFALALLLGWLAWGRPLGAALAERDAKAERFNDAIRDLATEATRAARLPEIEAALAATREAHAHASAELAGLRAGAEERARAHEAQLAAMREQFEAAAAKTLEGAQTTFLHLAKETFAKHQQEATSGLEKNKVELKAMLDPVQVTLRRYEEGLTKLERDRVDAYGSLKAQIESVRAGQDRVRDEAQKLSVTLRSSTRAAGRWGEEQCRNVLEKAGLQEGIDFDVQAVSESADSRQRPDFVVRLPGGRCLVIDAKCSLDAYVAAADAADEADRARHLAAHAAAVRAHATGLMARGYEKQFAGAADFVIMFVPGENFLSAAIEQDRSLLDWAHGRKLVLAAPINLIAIARTVAALRDQERVAKEAQEIARLGRDVYEAIATLSGHVGQAGRSLGSAVEHWNRLVGSLDSRVLVRARRFSELGIDAGKATLVSIEPIDAAVRLPSAPELLPAAAAAE